MYPLCISMLSGFAMIFIDKIFLSRYSLDTLAAISSGGTLFWMVTGFFVYLASIAGVYVGKLNGAGTLTNVAQPMWHMVILSIISIPIFILIAPALVNFFHSTAQLNFYQKDYLICNYAYSPLMVMSSALSSFFIGLGMTSIVTYSGLIGNLVNVFLDYFLIFGIKDTLQPMGIKGAALATGIGLFIQCAIMICAILSKKNNQTYNTRAFSFNIKIFWNMIKDGGASSIALTIELLGWSAFYMMISKTTNTNALFASINQSIFIFFLFFSEALEKSVSAIAGNLIGANNLQELKNLRYSATKISLIFGVIIALLLVTFKSIIIKIFINDNSSMDINEYHIFYNLLTYSMPILAIYITAENIRFLLKGLLVAMKNSLYIMIVEPICIWFFMVCPAYLFFNKLGLNIAFSLVLFTIFSIVTSVFLWIRLRNVEKNFFKLN